MSNNAFYGLHVAKTGLFASQKGLELTGHNISNAGTEGYTRQRLNLTNLEGATTDAIILQATNGQVGRGVGVVNIQQIRDQFLDAQYRDECSEQKMWETRYETLYYVEDIIHEPTDIGLSSVLLKFYESLQEFAKEPQSEDIRNLVRQNAITMTESMNHYAGKLEALQKEQDDAIVITTKQINAYLNDIAALNTAIRKYELNGENANDLMDKRNLAMDKLSELIDISYKYNEHNMVSIYFGNDNTTLIDNETAINAVNLFEITEGGQSHYGSYTFHDVSVNGVTVDRSNISGGTMKGYYNMRDGSASEDYGLDFIMQQFDLLSDGIVKIFNKINSEGYSIPDEENGNKSQQGLLFFDESDTSALHMQISDDLKQSVWNIAGSDAEVDLDAENTNEGNNKNALRFAAVSQTNYDDLGIGRIDDFLAGIVSEIGVQAEYTKTMNENQEIIMDSIYAQRQSVSGVSIDEEVTNIITFSKSYQAASRMITAVDEMLDKLINGTGVVGR
ncbi:MAG: flagellar hook-associated protein FlgK [Oscillospiraceae bacterium]|nr:flagellar hook-associated protein FlgK [Oscillospiraceae bacterium]